MHRQNPLSILLCMRIKGGYDTENLSRVQIMLAGLQAFWRGDQPVSVTIVVKPDEIMEIHKALGYWENLVINLVDQENLIQGITDFQAEGWWKQQALKIAATRHMTTEFVLIMEPDVICCKPFSSDDLIKDGRAVTQWTERNTYWRWFNDSAATLRTSCDMKLRAMDATPQIVTRRGFALVERDLENLYGDDYWSKLLTLKLHWTEYALYNLTLDRYGLTAKLHIPPDESDRSLYADKLNNAGKPGDFPDWSPDRLFQPDSPGYFIIFQSSLRVPAPVVWGRVKRFIEPLMRRESVQKLRLSLEQ